MDDIRALALLLNEVEYTIDEGRPTLGQTEEVEEALVKVEGIRHTLKVLQDRSATKLWQELNTSRKQN